MKGAVDGLRRMGVVEVEGLGRGRWWMVEGPFPWNVGAVIQGGGGGVEGYRLWLIVYVGYG